jgi:hypothetical protein
MYRMRAGVYDTAAVAAERRSRYGLGQLAISIPRPAETHASSTNEEGWGFFGLNCKFDGHQGGLEDDEASLCGDYWCDPVAEDAFGQGVRLKPRTKVSQCTLSDGRKQHDHVLHSIRRDSLHKSASQQKKCKKNVVSYHLQCSQLSFATDLIAW